VIFNVAAQMARQVIDARGEQGDLKVGAAGVLVVLLEGANVNGGCFAHWMGMTRHSARQLVF
jgi:hypothetical protein